MAQYRLERYVTNVPCCSSTNRLKQTKAVISRTNHEVSNESLHSLLVPDRDKALCATCNLLGRWQPIHINTAESAHERPPRVSLSSVILTSSEERRRLMVHEVQQVVYNDDRSVLDANQYKVLGNNKLLLATNPLFLD